MDQDSFTILELLSQSATTSVYKAHQNALDRTVLLKVLHKHLLRDQGLVSRFSREAKACAILRSENIVQVYDLTEVDGAPAMLMEFVQGKSLEDLLNDETVRSEALLMKVARSVLNALRYAHDRGVVHRDIKPGNILISEDGTIKVTDFGLATVPDAPSLTMEGSLIGTPAYMSPEQARGETVDYRTDLFSLGITLVEVLTGDKILAGRSYAECITRIQSFNLDSIAYLAPKCSPHIFEFLKRMLAPDKHDRFASADEALHFLEEGAASPESRQGSRAGHEKKNSGIFIAGAVVLAIIILVVVLSLVPRNQPVKTAGIPSDTTVAERTRPAHEKGISQRTIDSVAGKRPVAAGNEASSRRETNKTPDVVVASGGPVTDRVAIASVDSGYVAVHCTPWAKIYIDNEFAGTTPIAGAIKMPIGEHTVTFNNQNFVPIVRRVLIRKNSETTVSADFLRSAGYIVVSVEPWGKVYVDDQLRETTPSAQAIIVSAGTRRIRIENPSFKDIVRNVKVDPGDTLRLNFNFFAEIQK